MYSIETLEVLRGQLPRRAHAMIIEWATMFRDELRDNWDRAREQLPLNNIDALE